VYYIISYYANYTQQDIFSTLKIEAYERGYNNNIGMDSELR